MILNLTQHIATEEQKAAGVIDLHEEQRQELCRLLTFSTLDDTKYRDQRAHDIANIVRKLPYFLKIRQAMIGGALFFMRDMEEILNETGIEPVYAFTEREAIEIHNPDGTVTKTAVFKHKGFVPGGE